jgi:diaminopimelate decarboxylase
LQELGCTAGALGIDGLAASQLAAHFGTPLYAFAAAVLDRRLAAVRHAFGRRVQILYSIKANPSLAVTKRLRAGGAGAEVASLGELHLALRAGHAAAELRFAGPGKTDAEIDAAVALGLGCFHAESADEVHAIADAARRHGRRTGVAVRVNLPQELGGARLRMGGRSSRFGVDEAQVPGLLRTIAVDPWLALRGLHVYGGTQCTEAAAFLRQASALVERAAAWERDLGLPLDELDLGGGFAVPAHVGDPTFDLAAAGAGLQQLLAAHDRPGRTWLVELGRWLVAPAGVYLTRIVREKTSGGERHLVLDGGLHHCAAAAGLGTVLRRAPLLVAVADPFATAASPVTVGGPLCTPADQFADQMPLPPLRSGDLVAVLHAGAYGLSFSPTAFLSHATPAEVLVERGEARVVRARGEPTDVLRGQSP